MKKNLFFLFIFCSSMLQAQNLVPNFSFEISDTCPNSGDQIQFATGWSKYNFWTATPDYFNACAPAGYFSVPDNGSSFQLAHRNCSAYAAIVTFTSQIVNYREHIGIQLSHQLTLGQKYYISFYAVMGGEKIIAGNYFEMPSNNIGIRLSTAAYDGNNPCPIDNFAHINYPMILNDSINWTHITGSIIADSAYNYLIVGNFFDDANTDTLHYNCDSCLNYYSYYFIDDICLSNDSLLCNGGIDILPCNVSVNEVAANDEIKVYPNPFNDFIIIGSSNSEKQYEIKIFDSFGRSILQKNISSQEPLQLNQLDTGIYFIQIISSKYKFTNLKIVKL